MAERRRRTWSWALVAVAGLGVAAVAYFRLGQEREGEPDEWTGPVEKITVAAFAGGTGALVYVAEDRGYFERNGLEVTIEDHESGKAAAEVLLRGGADVSTSAGLVFVNNSFEHPDLRAFGTVATAEVKKLVARRD